MRDAFARRSGADYAEALAALLPRGPAWPTDQDSVLQRLVSGLAEIWGAKVDARAADMLTRESDPRATIELLDDWERAFGLPDPCLSEPLTIGDRQEALVGRITMEGGQSRAFFKRIAAAIGYEIEIIEHAPFMAGVSRAGDTRPTGAATEWFRWETGPETIRFYWTVLVLNQRITWFRATTGEAGVDPHVQIGIASDLECLLRRLQPAHAEIAFDYSGLGLDASMAGTP